MKNKPRTIEIDADTDARLRALAERRGQTPADVIADAVELLDLDDEELDIAEDLRRLREFERTGLSVPFEDVKAWIESWGTPNELPPPKAQKPE